MKRLVLPLTVLVMAALLYGSATPAHACTCGAPRSMDEARRWMDESDLVIFASISGFTGEAEAPEAKLVMDVEQVLNDRVTPDQIVVDQSREITERLRANSAGPGLLGPDCGYTVAGALGERYFLMGSEGDEGYRLSGCVASIDRQSFESSESHALYRAALVRQLPYTGGGPPGQEGGSDAESRPLGGQVGWDASDGQLWLAAGLFGGASVGAMWLAFVLRRREWWSGM